VVDPRDQSQDWLGLIDHVSTINDALAGAKITVQCNSDTAEGSGQKFVKIRCSAIIDEQDA
jgi:hypothetical protein